MKKAIRPAIFKWQTAQQVVICAVRWYLRYSLSLRDVEELLTERGLEADYTTICRFIPGAFDLSPISQRLGDDTPGPWEHCSSAATVETNGPNAGCCGVARLAKIYLSPDLTRLPKLLSLLDYLNCRDLQPQAKLV